MLSSLESQGYGDLCHSLEDQVEGFFKLKFKFKK